MQKYLQIILQPNQVKRTVFFILSDIIIIICSLYLAFEIRFEFAIPLDYKRTLADALYVFIILKIVVFIIFRMYKIIWRYVGIRELYNIICAIITSEVILAVLILVPLPSSLNILPFKAINGFPRSIFIIDGFVSIILIAGFRISKRLYLEGVFKKRIKGHGKRTLILGAGHTGEMILRDMAKQNVSEFYPVGALDDDISKIGGYLHGIKVLGNTDELNSIVRKHDVTAIIIAIPSLNHKALKKIYGSAKELGINTVKIVPRIYDFHKPDIKLKSLEDIRVEDLIGRQMVEVDYAGIESFLAKKTILITGAGGSIGSEIVLQACAFNPEKVILFDIDETELHNLGLRLKKLYPNQREGIDFIIGDVRDEKRIEDVFDKFHPQIIFHAAAYKHVPIMEHNPKEAIKVNIFGTYNLVKASIDRDVQKFIMISTDKAVRPTSIMGATKRLSEHICKAFDGVRSQESGIGHNGHNTEFISVRFGNVLGSRGSVLPLFMEQLKYGGPLTVTHDQMKRYFMTISEAVSLVFQASVIGKGGEILVLDMGEPVKILSLAEDLIRIHGLEPYKDINIEITGIRPGEKLFEEILTAEEGTLASNHKKIFIAKNTEKYSIKEIEDILKEFEILIGKSAIDDEGAVKKHLKKYIKYYVET